MFGRVIFQRGVASFSVVVLWARGGVGTGPYVSSVASKVTCRREHDLYVSSLQGLCDLQLVVCTRLYSTVVCALST